MATREPLPLGTDFQIGDVLRLDGLSTKGASRIDNRPGAYYTVRGIDNRGRVVLVLDEDRTEAARGSREDLPSLTVPWNDLHALIESAVFVLLPE